MWPFKRNELEFWNNRYIPLAAYNAEVARGILHTDEWKEKMQNLQIEYDEAMHDFINPMATSSYDA